MNAPELVESRAAVLDALAALAEQRRAVVLVGAHAVYLRVGDAGLAVDPYTLDADMVLWPELLLEHPPLHQLLRERFRPVPDRIGRWRGRRAVVDFLVPESVGGPGRRAARLPAPHGRENPKDSLDVLRLLRGTDTVELAQTVRSLKHAPLSGDATERALIYLASLFRTPGAPGSQMAAAATHGLEDAEEMAASCAALTCDLLAALQER